MGTAPSPTKCSFPSIGLGPTGMKLALNQCTYNLCADFFIEYRKAFQQIT